MRILIKLGTIGSVGNTRRTWHIVLEYHVYLNVLN